MKKNIVALAVASAIAAPVAMADAPTVYGQMNMALQNVSEENGNGNIDGDGVAVNSIASRLGVKGSSDLGNGLKAVYKVEFGLTPDGSDAMKNRNQYVGLAGGFGTVLMGRHDTPTKMSQVKDFFNDGPGDLKQSSVTASSSLGGGEIRTSNVLAYVSPSFGGVKLVAAAVPSEGSKLDDNGNAEDSGIADTYSVAAMYGSKKEGLYLGAGYDSYGQQNYTIHDGATAANIDANYTRLSAQYSIKGLTVNGMYAMTDIGKGATANADDLSSTTWMMAASYKVGKFTPKAKYSVSGFDDKTDAEAAIGAADLKDKTMMAIGVDYSLGKKTKAYAEYVNVDNDSYGRDDHKKTTYGVGILHKF